MKKFANQVPYIAKSSPRDKISLGMGWALMAGLLILLFSCAEGTGNLPQKAAKDAPVYTCVMHPQVRETHPGNCPICGMKLVLRVDSGKASAAPSLGTVLQPANEYVISSLPVTTPLWEEMSIPVRAYGAIEYDPRATGSISARVSGRIERMYVRYRYQQVVKGQRLMDIYSPELLTAEQDLLFLLKADRGNTSFIEAAKQKLLLLGMSKKELDQVIRVGAPLYRISIYSNGEGYIHDASMGSGIAPNDMKGEVPLTRELSLREGMYVQKDQPLFMIMSHLKVRATLQIFASDESLVKTGDPVIMTPEVDTSHKIHGRIDFIEPFYRSGSKTLTARIYFQNRELLPVGSQVTGLIETRSRKGLWLPRSAVLSLGLGEVVFLKSANHFVAHKVITGVNTPSVTQVMSGLGQRDTVAVNAQFLIDGESFIRTPQKK